MKRHRHIQDPHWLTARFTSKCHHCAQPIRKGARAFYYPNGRKIYGEACGCAAPRSAEFEAAAQDEAIYQGSSW